MGSIKQLAIFGDSLSIGNLGNFSYFSSTGRGCWAELVADRLSNIEGYGPLLSSGIRPVGIGLVFLSSTEWSFTTGGNAWTAVTSSNAYEKLPYGYGAVANGAAKIATYNVPSQHRPIVGFQLYYVDYTSGGNWQYRVDGGTWTNMAQSLSNNNVIRKFYVASAVTTSIDIRASSDASTGVGCYPAAIELFYTDPRPAGTNGLIVHNFAINGERLNNLVATTSGDRMAIVDSVQLGTGNPITNQPDLGVIMMHINDTTINSTSTWASNLTTFRNRMSPLGPVTFMNPWEAAAGFSAPVQTSYRAQTKTSAAGYSPVVPVLDFYDSWSARGWTGNAACNTAGLFMDLLHESQFGHFVIADLVYWWLRTQILTGLSGLPSDLIVKSSPAAKAYAAANSSVAYSAGTKVSLNT